MSSHFPLSYYVQMAQIANQIQKMWCFTRLLSCRNRIYIFHIIWISSPASAMCMVQATLLRTETGIQTLGWVELVLKYHMQHRTRRINLCENLHIIHYHMANEAVWVSIVYPFATRYSWTESSAANGILASSLRRENNPFVFDFDSTGEVLSMFVLKSIPNFEQRKLRVCAIQHGTIWTFPNDPIGET